MEQSDQSTEDKELKLEKTYIAYSPMYFEKYLNDPKKYGLNVKQKRESLKLSTRTLAARIGISHSKITKIENGNFRFIDLATLELIARELKCCPLYLLGKSVSEKVQMETMCYTNPYSNEKLLDFWSSQINNPTIIEQIQLNPNEYPQFLDYTMKSMINAVKANKYGIKIKLGTEEYYFLYLKKDYYIKNSVYRNERYIECRLFSSDKNNSIVNNLSINESEYLTDKSLKDIMVIQKCSIGTPMVEFFDNKSINLSCHYKLNEIFTSGFMQYKNYNLIDFLFEMSRGDKLNEQAIIRHLSWLINKNEVNNKLFCETIDIFFKLDRRKMLAVNKAIKKMLADNNIKE